MQSCAHPWITPVGAVVRGLASAAVGTLAMDLLLFARYKRGDGKSGFREWELSEGIVELGPGAGTGAGRQTAGRGPVPARLRTGSRPLVNNITHWGYGIVGGAPYGLVVGSLTRNRVWFGVPFGAGVWGSGYVVLPAAGLYQPIWEYDRRTLANDLSAHLVYGLTTAAVFRALSPRRGR